MKAAFTWIIIILIMIIVAPIKAEERLMRIDGQKFQKVVIDSNYHAGLLQSLEANKAEISALKNINNQLETRNTELERSLRSSYIFMMILIVILIIGFIIMMGKIIRRNKAITDLKKNINDLRNQSQPFLQL